MSKQVQFILNKHNARYYHGDTIIVFTKSLNYFLILISIIVLIVSICL